MQGDIEILKRIDEAFGDFPVPAVTTLNLLENARRHLAQGHVVVFRFKSGCAQLQYFEPNYPIEELIK